MRILQINKFAYPKGGAEVYMLRTALKLKQRGHHVAVFGSTLESGDLDRDGIHTFDVQVPEFHTAAGPKKVAAAANVLWSTTARAKLQHAIDTFRPDVAHLHNYAHQLSPSIIKGLNDNGVPHLYTAHDYKLVCPAYVATVAGSDCFSCARKVSAKLVKKQCHHGSKPWSIMVGLEALEVRTTKLVPKRLLAPSEFMQSALENSWLSGNSTVRLVRNPVEGSGIGWVGGGDFILYVGRLSREKGVDSLITAAVNRGVRVVLAGDGPLRIELQEKWEGHAVDLVGHVDESALSNLRRSCIAQVIPSSWPENAPLAALEAAADGVPLIVTNRGGLPELARLGARVSCVENITSESIGDAMRQLDSMHGDKPLFQRETSWDLHLDILEAEYLMARGLK